MDSRIVARKIAEEAIVLLKNESKLLPFSKGQRAAFLAEPSSIRSISGTVRARLTRQDAKISWRNVRRAGSARSRD